MPIRSLGRFVVLAVPAAVLALPLWSIFTRADVPAPCALIVACLFGLALARPTWGTVLAAGLLPLSLGVHRLAGGALTSTAVAEVIVLAFASAATLRLPRLPADDASWLSAPAIMLGSAVAASALVDLSMAAAVAPDRPFGAELWTHMTVTYWTEDAGNWGTVHDAIRWLAVLATAVGLERHLRSTEHLRRLVTWTWLSAAAAAMTFTVLRVIEIVSAREIPAIESLRLLLTTARLSVLHPDQNAAGSILGLLIVAALVIGRERRSWWFLTLATPLFALGFVLAQSRAAIGALALVGVAHALTSGRPWRKLVPVLVAATLAMALAGVWMVSSRSHVGAGEAVGLRVELARVGVRMAARYPVWGVGLGDYARTSRRFVSAQATPSGFGQFGENAHNNYLQVAVELGIPAGVAFLWLVLPLAGAAWVGARASASPEFGGLTLGLTVFLTSAVFGHPLLIPEVAGMFFFALGLAASHARAPRWFSSVAQWLASGAAIVYAISVLWRGRF